MKPYGIALDDVQSVKDWSCQIYDHLASRAMPLTNDESHYWPDDALEQFRIWVNEGWRRDDQEPVWAADRIPPPIPRPSRIRLRKNILHLTQRELDHYRMRLEEIGIADPAPDSPWQRIAAVHTDWCLHYQEAFLLWHRANLLWFEQQLGFPIPYWNFMSPAANRDGDPEAGLPQPFKDLIYVHPRTGEVRPNPLRFAAARNGRSKACAKPDAVARPPREKDCGYVQRDPLLYTSGDDRRAERQHKLNQLVMFQEQVVNALQWGVFSTPEGSPGYPWANLPTFHPPQPDRDYPHRCDFDGLYEQPHDNFHGWVGPDMADNSYTAYDPVFWSLHSGIDRVFEEWLRAHPAATFTSGFPLRPFTGPRARRIDPTDPDVWAYSTIGDMARDSRSLGYDFEPRTVLHSLRAPGAGSKENLYVVFPNVRCTLDTYTIDVFVNLRDPRPEDMQGPDPSHYAGRMTRLGMGVDDDKGRCVPDGVVRVLNVTPTAQELHLRPDSQVEVGLLVTDVSTGSTLDEAEYRQLPGFVPFAVWGSPMTGSSQTSPASQASAIPHPEGGRHIEPL